MKRFYAKLVFLKLTGKFDSACFVESIGRTKKTVEMLIFSSIASIHHE